MDIEYDNKLKAIMAKHNTDKWNAECENDHEYKRFELAYSRQMGSPNKKKSIGVTIGSYKFRSKKK